MHLTFSASVKLSPHGNMSVPSPRMDLNVLALDSREQSVTYDAVLIPVS